MAVTDWDMKATGFSPKIRYEGVFDLNGLFSMVRKFFADNYYIFTEKNHKYKTPTPFGHDLESTWFGWHNMNDYVRYTITVDFHFFDMTNVDVEVDGKKVKLDKARFEIIVSGKVELDYEGQFEKSKFLERVRRFYHAYVIKSDILAIYEDKLYYQMFRLNAKIKDFLDMQGKYNAYAGVQRIAPR